MSRKVTLGPIVSYREWLSPTAELTTGDEWALEKLDCERAALRGIIAYRPHRAAAARARLAKISQDAADIARRYR